MVGRGGGCTPEGALAAKKRIDATESGALERGRRRGDGGGGFCEKCFEMGDPSVSDAPASGDKAFYAGPDAGLSRFPHGGAHGPLTD